MDNWLFIGICAVLIVTTVVGYFRGFIKLAITLVGLVASIFIVRMATPYVSQFLKEATPIYTTIEKFVDESLEIDAMSDELSSSQQTEVINGMSLPALLKKALVENNNSEVYQVFGVQWFKEYISHYISSLILNALSFLLAFIFVFTMIQILVFALDIVSRLPVLKGINRIAGAAAGLVQGLCMVWLFCLIVTVFASTPWGVEVFQQIEANAFLKLIYENNLFVQIILSLLTMLR